MRALQYLAAIVLALPQILLCTAFALLEHLTSAGSLGGFFARAFEIVVALFSWKGLLLLLSLFALVLLGFFSRVRWIGAAILGITIVASAVILLWLLLDTMTLADGWIFLPGLGALTLSLRLLLLEFPFRLEARKKIAAPHKKKRGRVLLIGVNELRKRMVS